MSKDFWRKSKVACVGGGSWGTVLSHLASQNVPDVKMWLRSEKVATAISTTRRNPHYVSDLVLRENVKAFNQLERVFDSDVSVVIWALPSKASREVAKKIAPLLRGDETIIHATKGVEAGSLKRLTEVLAEELPCSRIGVLSGPNLAVEVARGDPAGTVVASDFEEVIEAGQAVFSGDSFRVYSAHDVVGVEWAGTLKNILAIASGSLDALEMGWNARAMLISRGLAEMVRFGTAMGGELKTFLGLAGVGDLLATCGSSQSRNYRVGYKLTKGIKLTDILRELGGTAEGVRTTKTVWEYAQSRQIDMPITEAVHRVIYGELTVSDALRELMTRPQTPEFWS